MFAYVFDMCNTCQSCVRPSLRFVSEIGLTFVLALVCHCLHLFRIYYAWLFRNLEELVEHGSCSLHVVHTSYSLFDPFQEPLTSNKDTYTYVYAGRLGKSWEPLEFAD